MTDEAPVLNVMIEDYLANVATEGEHAMLLQSWLRLGVEYTARLAGRSYTREALQNLERFVRDARPSPDWQP